ncbi:XRE family transcriptional regulator [Paenibacillus psychroresistens]|uniref:XRE family transcriptional regulator n=1 Tax=Paenibacillus psychroresistens TaxID=1778678 RepID=A0A6B8RFN7_9BACL|nr:helix-turn-helix transcriptional regulator [Paenibacillus psychroresistens]QGQ94544.1 XRE family transcriptional regulator [Paenibacillus psychroresistens]
MEFAEKLKELRQLKGMTLRKLSEKACVSYSIMNAIENGKFQPTKEVVVSIAYALKHDDVKALLLLSGNKADDMENN